MLSFFPTTLRSANELQQRKRERTSEDIAEVEEEDVEMNEGAYGLQILQDTV